MGASGERGPQGERGIDGRDGRDGNDGRDAAELVILPAIEPGRNYARGTFACDGGGLKRFDGIAWATIIRGIADYSFRFSETDPRQLTACAIFTDGEKHERTWRIPMAIYRETWKAGEYMNGDMVTRDGSVWHCQTEKTRGIPGASEDWKLCVKRGNDGKNGAIGPVGPAGKDLRYE